MIALCELAPPAQWLAIMGAGAAAILWWRSASVKTPGEFYLVARRASSAAGGEVPDQIGIYAPERIGHLGNVASQDLADLGTALESQSRFSRWAAFASGFSAATQALVFYAQSHPCS